MPNVSLLAQLHELAQSPATFSNTVLGGTQAGIDKKTGIINGKFGGKVAYENEEVSKIDRARSMLRNLLSDEDFDRQVILSKLMRQLDVTEETATSYFQRIAKELGVTGASKKSSGNGGMSAEDDDDMVSDESGDEDDVQNSTASQDYGSLASAASAPNSHFEQPEIEEDPSGDPDKQGAIRVIPNAHLVYKRQNESGTYDELWVYNVQTNVSDELEIRRDILAGTDIEPKSQSSKDGNQEYRLSTMGNAQLLHITGMVQ